MEKVFLIDAYALIFRMYYAFIGRPMRNNEGLNTSAIFGFVKFLNDLIKKEHPHYLGVAFDPKGGSYRNELYTEYKANRESTPEDILSAVPYIKQILEAMRIPILEIPGYEADDVIGTLSVKGSEAGYEIFMVTPDKDFGQLLRPNVYIYKQAKGGQGIEIIDREKIKENYGFDDPCLIADMLALWGDASDNIPGIPGIGEKSAVKLIGQYGPVENIIAHAGEIKGKNGQNIAAMADQLRLSKQLATIDTNVPIDFTPEALKIEEPDVAALAEIYRELGFNSFLRELDRNRFVSAQSPQPSTTASSVAGQAPDLFSSMGASIEGSVVPNDGNPALDEGFDTIDTVVKNYSTLDREKIGAVIEQIKEAGIFAFSLEISGPDVFNDRIIGISVSTGDHHAAYFPFPENKEDTAYLLSALQEVLGDPTVEKITHDAKTALMVLHNYGIEVGGFIYDTLVIHYLIDPESRHAIDFLAKRYLGYAPVPLESLVGKGVKQIPLSAVETGACSRWSCEQTDMAWQLKNRLWPILLDYGLEPLYRDIEEPLIRVLASIELEGVRIDAVGLHQYGKELSAGLADIEAQIREMAGEPNLNVNSAKQLGEALFGKMKIDPNAKMTKTKQYKTDEDYLQSIADRHPVIPLVLEYRGIRKLMSTYIEALPKLINPKTGKIHTSFNQAVTATGRLSSNNPNLQNIPIRTEQGRMLRKFFVPSCDDCSVLSADYSQVELRLMAHLSGDEAMIADFMAEKDIHTATAARVFGIPENEVIRDQRSQAKTANFGIIYGISAFGLSQRLHIARTDAKEIIEGYFQGYPGVKRFIDESVAEARESGYVTTLFGRKCYLPDIKSSNGTVRGLAERNAINAPIQGGAADIIKIAMIRLEKRLRDEGLQSRIILQVHDELVLNVFNSELEQVQQIVIESMEQAAKLQVPLVVEASAGANWLEAH